MVTSKAPKVSFKEQMLQAREQALIDAVNRLLAEKGFEAMTVDEVAAEVGIAKASLYKHFPSKEDLAAAAMAHLMDKALEFVQSQEDKPNPLDKLRATVAWTMRLKLSGNMPTLPSQNSTLRATLMRHKRYMDGLMEVSERLGAWIEAAQAQGHINKTLPVVVVLYTLFARACDPVLEFMQATGAYSNDAIVDMVLSTCFDGLCQR